MAAKVWPNLGEWLADASCVGVDPEVFFNDDTEEYARRICEGCPVIGPCLDYALTNHVSGIWANTSGRERWRMRRGQRLAERPLVAASSSPTVCPGCRLTGAIMPVGGGSLECGTCGARWPGSFT